MELEASYALDHENFAHLWLLHHLFLKVLDKETQTWVSSWNLHRVAVPEGGQRSPYEMFLFGMIEYGVRGVDLMVENEPEIEDLALYGIDWAAQDLVNHALACNPEEWDEENPFLTTHRPNQMTTVICDEPDSPLTPEQIIQLDQQIFQRFNLESNSMAVRKEIWAMALQICMEFQV